MAGVSQRRKVLLIGWDAADWQHLTPLLEEGLMPTLDAPINRGVMGNLATLQPILSPMLWNSVATGKLTVKHGIHGFIEPEPGEWRHTALHEHIAQVQSALEHS